MREELVPPNPNELERKVLNPVDFVRVTRFSLEVISSGCSRLMFGAMNPLCIRVRVRVRARVRVRFRVGLGLVLGLSLGLGLWLGLGLQMGLGLGLGLGFGLGLG